MYVRTQDMKIRQKIMAALAAVIMMSVMFGMETYAANDQLEYVTLQTRETKQDPGTVWTMEPYVSASGYEIVNYEWSREYEDWEPGKKVTLTVYLESADKSFAKKPSVSAWGLELVSATRTDSKHLKVKLNYIPKVTLTPPTGICYEDEFTLTWDKVQYAGGYEIQIMRDGIFYTTVTKNSRTDTKIDLSQYATDDRLVTVKLRSVAPSGKSGYILPSEWVNFDDEVYVNGDNTAYGQFNGNGTSRRFYYNDGWNDYTTGWEYINGAWYYFQPENGYAVTNGWKQIDGYWYLFDMDGRMLTGWQQVNGLRYYLNDGLYSAGIPDGAMCTGWKQINGTWYYFQPGGGNAATNGWQMVGGQWYLFDASGRMLVGWQQTGGYWYYLNAGFNNMGLPIGAMCTGWITTIPGGAYYWLNNGTMQGLPLGAMLADAMTPDGYYVNASGEWRQ